MKEENTEYQAGATIVNDGIKFNVGKRSFTVKPLTPYTIVRISMEASLMKPIGESDNMIAEMLDKGKNLKHVARIVAIATLNKAWKIRLFGRMLAGYLLRNTENLEYLLSYLNVVYRQMSPHHFFFITTLTKGMNMMAKKQEKPKAD